MASTSPSPKQDRFIRPNPHPYAIQTTSSGLLTRSNSTSQNNHASRHYYVPPNHTQSKPSERRPRTHRLSKSLTNEAVPRPLPTPPDHIPSSQSAPLNLTPKRKQRASTLSSSEVIPYQLEDLPSNPKVWTPSQLSSYLMTALRVRSGETLSLPLPVARDIAAFVKEAKINGRVFLRLCEQDLESMGVNKLWQSALLSSSRDLRQNVLKGRIWGTSAEDEQFPFSSDLYNSSTSSVDLPATDGEPTRPTRRHRNGRVRGMVETFERGGSFSSDGGFSDTGIDIGAANGYRDVDEEAIVQSPVEMRSLNSSPVRRPLPQPPVHPSLRDFPPEPEVDEEEPTMEELLAADVNAVSGARAWEEMDMKPGVTVRKLLTNGDADDGLSTIVHLKSGGSRGSNRLRDSRRIVTAVFTPKPTAEDLNELLKAKEEELEAQVESTRALLEEFKKRLEQVEQKVDETQLELELKARENAELKEKLRESEQALVRAPLPVKLVSRRKSPYDLDPQSISALSQYVLFAGLGVCAVVLRVVLKKVVGRGLKN